MVRLHYLLRLLLYMHSLTSSLHYNILLLLHNFHLHNSLLYPLHIHSNLHLDNCQILFYFLPAMYSHNQNYNPLFRLHYQMLLLSLLFSLLHLYCNLFFLYMDILHHTIRLYILCLFYCYYPLSLLLIPVHNLKNSYYYCFASFLLHQSCIVLLSAPCLIYLPLPLLNHYSSLPTAGYSMLFFLSLSLLIRLLLHSLHHLLLLPLYLPVRFQMIYNILPASLFLRQNYILILHLYHLELLSLLLFLLHLYMFLYILFPDLLYLYFLFLLYMYIHVHKNPLSIFLFLLHLHYMSLYCFPAMSPLRQSCILLLLPMDYYLMYLLLILHSRLFLHLASFLSHLLPDKIFLLYLNYYPLPLPFHMAIAPLLLYNFPATSLLRQSCSPLSPPPNSPVYLLDIRFPLLLF